MCFKDLSNISLTEDGVGNFIEKSNDSVYNRAKGVYRNATTDMASALKGDDEYRLNLVLENLKNPNFQFYPIYVSRMDSIGHKFGPNSEMTKSSLKHIDKLICNFVNKAQDLDEHCVIVLCGDHGMTEVNHKINLEKALLKMKKNNLFADCKYFLDSTVARFWFDDNQEKNAKSLSKIIDDQFKKFGKSILLKDFKDNDIPQNRKYGDLIFTCKPGVIISPDFFNLKSNIRGMHGYKTNEISTYGFCLTISKDITTCIKDGPLPLTYVHKIISRHLSNI